MASMNTPKPLHIFRAGRHTTMAGETLAFSEADLAATAAAYSPSKHEAPLVIGHPKTDDPAHGWVTGLLAQGANLFAVPRAVDPAFAESVNSRAFPKVSAKFYRPDAANNPVPGVWYLRHVGFLGAVPPAIKGLADPSFAEASADAADLDCVCFQECLPTTEPEPTVTPEQAAALQAENDQLKAQLAATAEREKQATAAKLHADNVAFAESLVSAGTLAPKHRAVTVALLDQVASHAAEVEFGEGDDKAALLPALKTFLQAMPKAVEFGEHATKDRADPKAGKPDNPLLADAERRSGKS